MLQTSTKLPPQGLSAPASPPNHGVRMVIVTVDADGQRLDNFLLRTLKSVPKSLVYRIIRRGEVRVNGHRPAPDRRLATGDTVRIPPLRQRPEGAPFQPSAQLATLLQNAIVHEDRALLVIDKPAGLAVHKGTGIDAGVIEAWRGLRPREDFLELAHRLDRDTSGCLVLAKTAVALRQVQEAFRTGAVDKRYLVLVRGYWNFGEKTVRLPLGRAPVAAGERKVAVVDGGKPAITHFRPVQLSKVASLLEVRIATGRTHQIRVHAAHMGHPVAGDEMYGDPAFNRTMASHGLHRLFLHAQSLILSIGGREVAVSAPLPDALKTVLSAAALQWQP